MPYPGLSATGYRISYRLFLFTHHLDIYIHSVNDEYLSPEAVYLSCYSFHLRRLLLSSDRARLSWHTWPSWTFE